MIHHWQIKNNLAVCVQSEQTVNWSVLIILMNRIIPITQRRIRSRSSE